LVRAAANLALPTAETQAAGSGLEGLFLASAGGDGDVHFERAVEEGTRLFKMLCPTAEFLPAAPNPEDIVWDDGSDSTEDALFGMLPAMAKCAVPSSQAAGASAPVDGRDDGASTLATPTPAAAGAVGFAVDCQTTATVTATATATSTTTVATVDESLVRVLPVLALIALPAEHGDGRK
jgi:hypothetical protein